MSTETNQSEWIVNTTDATFAVDVFQRSKELPVVVDFWADWCAPCRALAPLLEKLAIEGNGSFLLVKANTEHCQQSAASFNVSSIPAVFAVRGGEAVDFFQGALPEEQLRQWLERIQPSEGNQLLADAKALQDSDPTAADEKFQAAMAAMPNEIAAKVSYAEFLTNQNRLEDSRDLLQKLHDDGYENDVDQLLQAVKVKLAGQAAGSVDQCVAACEANPDDLGLKLTLAEAYVADGQFEVGLQTALSVLQADKANHGERAKGVMLAAFNLLPEDSELISDYRRKLASALY